MKRAYLSLLWMISVMVFGQSQSFPDGLPYQAVARGENGEALVQEALDLKVCLLAGSASPVEVYCEKHEVVTDEQGYFSFLIGRGKTLEGSFHGISWSEKPIWVQVSLSSAKLGTDLVYRSRLLTVPYAFWAKTAAALTGPELKSLPTVESWSMFGNDSLPEGALMGHKNPDQDLVFKTNDEEVIRILSNGIVKLDSFDTVGGLLIEADSPYRDPMLVSEETFSSYPLRIQGGDQGVAVVVHSGYPENRHPEDHNFISFWETTLSSGNPRALGRIEPDYDILYSDENFRFQFFTALNAVFAFSEAGACAMVDTPPEIPDFMEVISNTVWGTSYFGFLFSHIAITPSEGVAYESGGADYAEYLLKADPAGDFKPGEIVGVHGGKISRQTTEADHLLVISLNPIIVGNMPQPAEEKNYEKVAFKGQVLTRVLGPVQVGDYILASGRNDGLGVAVHPDSMQPDDYRNVVGTAWSAAKPAGFNLVNVAVGLSPNDLHHEVSRQQQELHALESRLDEMIAYLAETREGFDIEPLHEDALSDGSSGAFPGIFPAGDAASPTPFDPATMTFDEWVDENSNLITAQTGQLRHYYQAAGLDFSQSPDIEAIFEDPVRTIKEVHSGVYLDKMLTKLAVEMKKAKVN